MGLGVALHNRKGCYVMQMCLHAVGALDAKLLKMHGCVFMQVLSFACRCTEEFDFLQMEKKRLQHWVEWTRSAVKDVMPHDPDPGSVEAGRQFWLRKWLLDIDSTDSQLKAMDW